MRGRLIIGAALALLVGACTSDPEATIVAPTTLPPADPPSAPPSNDAAPDATTATAPAEASTTDATSTSPPPTSPPATTTAAPTTEVEVVGDGPVLTAATVGDEIEETPGIPAGLVPAFFAFDATITTPCSDSEPGSVALRWEVIGTETVDIAIDDITNIAASGQPPAGQLELPLDCAGTTYFVVAENPDGRSNRSVTLP